MYKTMILIGGLLLFSQQAFSQAHVHGEGQLLIAQDHQQWQFEFVLPAADLLGFEHQPESEEQKQQVAMVKSKVESVTEIISLPAFCKLVTMSHSLPEVEADNHSHERGHEHDNKHTHSHSHSGHAHRDITLVYLFDCDSDLASISVPLFTWTSSLKTLNAHWISNQDQGARQLNASSNELVF